jgi:hypothetical protein
LRISLAKISFTSDWYGNPFFSAVLRNRPKTSNRIAMSFLGSSPIVGLPIRRMDEAACWTLGNIGKVNLLLLHISFVLCGSRAAR